MSRFAVKLTGEEAEKYTEKDKLLSARMYKAITMILFKLEGQKILRNPAFRMADRLLLDKVDYEHKTVTVDGKVYPMLDTDFPTVDPRRSLYPHPRGGDPDPPADPLLPPQ